MRSGGAELPSGMLDVPHGVGLALLGYAAFFAMLAQVATPARG